MVIKPAQQGIIILGTAGSSRDIVDIINDINKYYKKDIYRILGFLDDDKLTWGQEINGIKVLGPLISAHDYSTAVFVNGIGSPESFLNKHKIISRTNLTLNRFATLIHPSASISKSAKLGLGVVIFQGVVLGSNVRLGNYVIVLPNTVISHDAVVRDFTCIAGCAYISGAVSIGQSCYIGANTATKESLSVGDGSLIGMGSVVINNIPSRSVYAGNPAKLIKKL